MTNYKMNRRGGLLALLLAFLMVTGGCGADRQTVQTERHMSGAVNNGVKTIEGASGMVGLSESEEGCPPQSEEKGCASKSEEKGCASKSEEKGCASKSEEEGCPPKSEDAADEMTSISDDLDSGKTSTLSLVMVGDILLHTPLAESARREDGTYDFTAVFANTKEEIETADLALVNQEVIIGGAELGVSGYPAFNAPFELGDALVESGFDVVCHATNHTLDKGKRGVLRCMEFWEDNYPETAVVGINETAEAQEDIYIYEQGEIRVAILNYTYGTNGIPLPEDMPYVVNLLEEDRVAADLQKAEELADFTIVCPHWGTEYLLDTSSQQKKWTEIFLKNGADLVIGTHPHVIEPIEWVTDEVTGREMLVYYSLGNFVNWTSGRGDGVANRMVGGMADVTLQKAADGTVFIADYGVRALVCHPEEGQDKVTVYKLSEYTDELSQRNAIVNQDGNFSREYCVNLCNEVWGNLWK